MRTAAVVVAATLATALLSACMTGRVLRGYPGYPFARFPVPASSDSTFFRLQPALEEEGFPLDYTLREEGYIATRSAIVAGRDLFLNVVVESEPPTDGGGAGSMVWLAAYEETLSGSVRVSPLEEEVWREVMAIAGRLSAAAGGGAPRGPSGADLSGR